MRTITRAVLISNGVYSRSNINMSVFAGLDMTRQSFRDIPGEAMLPSLRYRSRPYTMSL